MFRTIDDMVMVAGQILPEDVTAAAAQGVRMIVNNRPEREEPGQPDGAAIAAVAQAAGLGYVAIPVDHSGFAMPQIDAMRAALAKGPVLAFCRSGTRSTYLWALARGAEGDDPQEIAAKARNAGYDVSGVLPMITQLQS